MSQRRRGQSKKGNQNGKQIIIDKAKKNIFDKNPLLTTSHQALCKKCGNRMSVIYLNYLKSGHFKLGEAKNIEVPHAYASGSIYQKEQVTPIIIEINCAQCESIIEGEIVSVEYLLFTIGKSGSEHFYS